MKEIFDFVYNIHKSGIVFANVSLKISPWQISTNYIFVKLHKLNLCKNIINVIKSKNDFLLLTAKNKVI